MKLDNSTLVASAVAGLLVCTPVASAGTLKVEGMPEPQDHFGAVLAVGDFDRDGFRDLVVGTPDEAVGAVARAGAVNVVYGGPGGLATAGNQLVTQETLGRASEAADAFGRSLAVGDFNGDGFDDLAIGADGDTAGTVDGAGAVHVMLGSISGLTNIGNTKWHQNTGGVLDSATPGERFGFSLAAGDFDRDGADDLAIGVVFEEVGGMRDAGAVNVLYGKKGVGLTAAGNQLLRQGVDGILGTAEERDRFGYALAVGDFDGDGFADLAASADGESVNSSTGTAFSAGAVLVVHGSPAGLTAAGNQLWNQNVHDVQGEAELGDLFGRSLAAADFDRDGHDDLAIGVPGESVSTPGGERVSAGSVNVLYGSSVGLTDSGDQLWNQAVGGIAGEPEFADHFGASLAVGDFDGDRYPDVAIGVPGERLLAAFASAGIVQVLHGGPSGLTASGSEMWHQDVGQIEDVVGTGDRFGSALAAGDFDRDGRSDLAVGVPSDQADAVADAGIVNVIHGSSTGLTDARNQRITQ